MAAMRVASSLGSGGARGYAHIGVINELRERGHQIVGTMWRSTTALLDTATARTLLDTPPARTVLSRFPNDGVETDDHDDHTESSVPRLGSF